MRKYNWKQIISEGKNYYKYQNSKKKKQQAINSIYLNAIPHNDIPKLSENMRESLEGGITFIELTDAI